MDILSRIGIVERASIDECYLDLTQESHIRLAACNGQPPLPVNADRVHICGQVGSCIWPAIQWMTAIPLSLLLTKECYKHQAGNVAGFDCIHSSQVLHSPRQDLHA